MLVPSIPSHGCGHITEPAQGLYSNLREKSTTLVMRTSGVRKNELDRRQLRRMIALMKYKAAFKTPLHFAFATLAPAAADAVQPGSLATVQAPEPASFPTSSAPPCSRSWSVASGWLPAVASAAMQAPWSDAPSGPAPFLSPADTSVLNPRQICCCEF